MPAGWAAGAAALGSVAGGLIGAGGAEEAAKQQAAAERAALAQQQSMFNTEQSNEAPYMKAGAGAASQLNYLLGEGGQTNPDGTPISNGAGGYGSLNQQFNADTFKSMSPQYQFNLQQGAQGTLNNASSGQGSESGAALKDLQSYNQNFANNSFNSAFSNYQTQQNNVFSRLSNLATLGSSAGSNSTTGAGQFSGQIGNTTAGIGAAQAGGTVGAANALSGGAQSLGNFLAAGNNNTGSTVAYTPPDLNMNNEYYANQ